MIDKFECRFLDTWESGTISFDFCSACYCTCSKRCRDYGDCSFCVNHNKDPSVCSGCSFSVNLKKAE